MHKTAIDGLFFKERTIVQALTSSALRADETIVHYVKGLNNLDDRLESLLMPLETEEWDVELPPSQQAVVETIIQQLQQIIRGQGLPIIQLVGADSLSKQLIAQQVAVNEHSPLKERYIYRLPVELLFWCEFNLSHTGIFC